MSNDIMCGIAGILGLEDKRTIKKMTDSIKHRGPDDSGHFVEENISLGHRRLSIIDLESGKQPIFNEDQSKVIVFNGEIYNYKELREKLKQKHNFKTNTDTEVILHLYEEKGNDFVKELEGIFAIAIYDLEKKKLILARDHLGIKPLFYTIVKDKIIFASEMKAIFQTGLIKAEFDETAIKEKFVFDDYTLNERTLFKGIKHLPNGTIMEAKNAKEYQITDFAEKKYFSHKADIGRASKQVYEELLKAVKSRLISDVSLGTLLSGGLDSSIIAALHREAVKDEEILTFSVTDEEGSVDSKKAKIVAERINSNHKEFTFNFEDIEKEISNFTYHLEDTEYGIVYNYFLNKKTKKYTTVVLSGNGADEVFGGYDRYKEMQGFREKIISRAEVFGKERTEYEKTANSIKGLNDFLKFEQDQGQLSNFQLAITDRNSMAFGVEVRVPFLQKHIVNYANSLNPELKLNKNLEKFILRKAAKRTMLPKEIVNRPKLPAGLSNTTPKAIPEFEKLCKKLVSKRKGKYDKYLKKPGKQVCMDILEKVFIENNAEKPTFELADIY